MGRPRRKVGLADQQGAARKDYARQRGTPHRHSSPDGSDLPLQGQDRPGRRDNFAVTFPWLMEPFVLFQFIPRLASTDPQVFLLYLE